MCNKGNASRVRHKAGFWGVAGVAEKGLLALGSKSILCITCTVTYQVLTC